MRLTLVIYAMSPGGAERVLSIIANYFAEKSWEISLITLDDGSTLPFYELHPSIVHQPLAVAGVSNRFFHGLKNNFKRIRALRRAIKKNKPQLVMSFMDKTNILVLISTLGLGLPVIVCERSTPSQYEIGPIWNFLRRLMYRRVSSLAVLTQNAVSYFPPGIRKHIHVIPNPVILPPPNTEKKRRQAEPSKKTVVAMGRLSEVKGFDLLIRAYALIAKKYPDWSLVIWGEGSFRPVLEKLRAELGLDSRVKLPGITKQPYEKFMESDLFVLSSRYEGFPNVVGEAMACGLPVISFDCPCGPSEIIREGVDGVLVPEKNVEALAVEMDRLMDDDKERKRLAASAPEVTERYGLEKVMKIWERLILEKIKS